MLSTRPKGLLLTLCLVLLLATTTLSCGQTAEPETPVVEPTTPVPTEVEVIPQESVVIEPPVTSWPTPLPVQQVRSLKDIQFYSPERIDPPMLRPFTLYARDYFIVTGYEGWVDCAVDATLSFIDPDSPGSQAFADLVSASPDEVRGRHQSCIDDPGAWSDSVTGQKTLLSFERDERLDLEYVKKLQESGDPMECNNLPHFEGNPGYDLVMNLYHMHMTDVPELGGVPLVKVIVGVLNQLVATDLVYATGNIEGTPYIGEGGGNETPKSATASTGTPEDTFGDQWALREKAGGGIELVTETGDPSGDGGVGVRVGVFDTSPFHGPGAVSVPSEIDWLQTVTAPALPAYSLPMASSTATQTLEHHGLFVASLINKVAPGTDVRLYQVLNEDGLGDLFTLNAALHTFISDTVNAEPSPVAAIMNLSLGSSVWLDPEVPTEWQDWIVSLKTLIAAAHCNHMVVVTSAGNYPDAPQTPAVLEETIAVQGSNRDRAQSCFNSPVHVNAKWVRAPGGGDLDPAKCEPVLDQCIEGDCPYALIGMVLDGNGQVDYDYWSGTSFAAPLVSGLSALLLEQEGDSFSPDEVYERIKDCADLPNRIIDVPATLNGSCP